MDSALLYGIVTLGVGLLALVVKYCFRSKCTEVTFCYGALEIKRDTKQEDEGKIDDQSPQRSIKLTRQTSI